jgi:hypothetical protein
LPGHRTAGEALSPGPPTANHRRAKSEWRQHEPETSSRPCGPCSVQPCAASRLPGAGPKPHPRSALLTAPGRIASDPSRTSEATGRREAPAAPPRSRGDLRLGTCARPNEQKTAGSGSEDPSPVHDAHGRTTQIRAARALNPTARAGGVATVSDSTPSLNGDPARRNKQRWPLRTPRSAQYQRALRGDAATFRGSVQRTTSEDIPPKRGEIGEARTDHRNRFCFGIDAQLTPSGRLGVSPPPRRPRLASRIFAPVPQHLRPARVTRRSRWPAEGWSSGRVPLAASRRCAFLCSDALSRDADT